ncbi:hypothetical protein [Taibaiella koreensis]|uniref:hypothetical protein n=1 Tax=Taibaiella koreensis TaxID=1268548 RepID=UPI000E5A08CC|nr:hypothetical protein [Taibaiella koreensis]
MLEILVLIYLCRRVKGIVAPKGYSAGGWQVRVVLIWFGLEIAGAFLSAAFGATLIIAVLSGLLCAILGAIILQQKAQSLPDRNINDWMDKMGKDDPDSY